MTEAREPEPVPAHPAKPSAAEAQAHSPQSAECWNVLHLFYDIDRRAVAALPDADRQAGKRDLIAILSPPRPGHIEQMQAFAVLGHKADFGIVMAGPDIRALHNVETSIAASMFGSVLVPSYSFVSVTEVSEYVPDVDQYARLLRDREGMSPESPAYKARVAQYGNRLEAMNRQRRYPEFPKHPYLCFYPMSKARNPEANWYTRPFSDRNAMMAEHGKSGMAFAGRVTQVITASTGLDDFEWGVTLWGREPFDLKDIVYTMRFDEASARYAVFGSFYFGYVLSPEELVEAVQL